MSDNTAPTSGATPTPRKRGVRRVSLRLVVSVLLVILAVIFIAQNREPTEVAFLTASAVMPLWSVLTGVAVLGLVVGYLVARRR